MESLKQSLFRKKLGDETEKVGEEKEGSFSPLGFFLEISLVFELVGGI